MGEIYIRLLTRAARREQELWYSSRPERRNWSLRSILLRISACGFPSSVIGIGAWKALDTCVTTLCCEQMILVMISSSSVT